MKTITTKTKMIFLALLACLISFIYIFSQNKEKNILFYEDTTQVTRVLSLSNTRADNHEQVNNVQNIAQSQKNSKNITNNEEIHLSKNKVIKHLGNQKLAKDTLPPQPRPEGHELQQSRQYQIMPPPAPDSKYTVNHQHTNRPDVGVNHKH
ncbi:hypothetical protein CJF42_00950 [Pseudoalteromonas sp. NBT06-2]|uniref:hypothetical protein n=1 Tax=Pseudoalteromonas sp. NBT06-2 TaxID=2025950 RepID=UPI000BA4EF23|nr:hypothetical protein [Pseudoalteromonas sp. NBT06-2]PAJ76288.1 hypothetical protein CJF42_00950 [Pseudoalteromonas sp. NBT06-2]